MRISNWFLLVLAANLTLVSTAKAACKLKGVEVVDSKGVSKVFANSKEAIDFAKDGSKIVFGEIPPKETLTISGKSDIVFLTTCLTKVESINIGSSKNVTVDGFRVNPVTTSGVTLLQDKAGNSNILLSNLEMDGYSEAKKGIEIGRSTDGVVITNVKISNFGSVGIEVNDGAKKIVVENSIVRNNSENGIVILGKADIDLKNNQIVSNGAERIATRESGFGILLKSIVGPNRQSQKPSVKMARNKILFNLGALDKQFKSDIEGVQFIEHNEENITTYGGELPGIKSWDVNDLEKVNPETTQFLNTVEGSERRFFERYATVVILGMKGSEIGASNFALVREAQMDQCLTQYSDYESKVTNLISSILGKDKKNLSKFLDRSDQSDKSLTSERLNTFCNDFGL